MKLEQVSDPGIGLTPIAVNMSLPFPQGNFEKSVARCQHWVTCLAEVTFLPVNKTQKLLQDKSSLPHDHY